MPTWGARGADAIAAMERDTMKKRSKESGGWLKPTRLWMPFETSRVVVFVDDDGYGVYEHRPYYDFTRKDHEFTCPGGGEECCTECGRPGLVVHYTIVDCDPWTDRDGEEQCYFMKLFPAKYGVYDKLAVKKAEDGGLAGKKVKCRRYKTKLEPAVGSEHNVLGEVEDPRRFFELVRYRGKYLTALFNDAEMSAEKLVDLDQLFELQWCEQEDDDAAQMVVELRGLLSAAHFDESAFATLKERFEKNAANWKGSLLVREVPCFNYEAILAAPSSDELSAIVEKVRSSKRRNNDDNGGGGGGGGGYRSSSSSSAPDPTPSGSSKVLDDDLPF